MDEFDRKFKMQGRKIVMIVDNCPAHPEVSGLTATNSWFLPPNTTSCTQQMDHGVIRYVCLLFSYFINKLNRIAIEWLNFAVKGLHYLKIFLIIKIET